MVIDQWDTLPAYSYNFTATVVHRRDRDEREDVCWKEEERTHNGPYDEHDDGDDATRVVTEDKGLIERK